MRSVHKDCPRGKLAEFTRSKDFDPLAVLRAAELGRIPRLLRIKHKRMCVSPFNYFRGSLPVMAADLASGPNTGIAVQICGDAHLKNFGFYSTSQGMVTFDLNDFDETVRAPWEWDVKRAAVSVVLAGEEAGLGRRKRQEAARAFLDSYCRWVGRFQTQRVLDVARHRVRREGEARSLQTALSQAERASPSELLARLALQRNGRWTFRRIKDRLWPLTAKEAQPVIASLKVYTETLSPERAYLFERYAVAAAGFKVVGTGSVGLRDYVLLMFSSNESDPLFLQIKEEPPSAYAPYLKSASAPAHNGRRVVMGQRALQTDSDLLLGWTSIAGRDYLVRQLNDHKSSAELESFKAADLREYSSICAELLAKGHARSGDVRAIGEYIGGGKKVRATLLQFAEDYAAQIEKDYRAFLRSYVGGNNSRGQK